MKINVYWRGIATASLIPASSMPRTLEKDECARLPSELEGFAKDCKAVVEKDPTFSYKEGTRWNAEQCNTLKQPLMPLKSHVLPAMEYPELISTHSETRDDPQMYPIGGLITRLPNAGLGGVGQITRHKLSKCSNPWISKFLA